ncbi:energy conserving hydrogenase EhbF [Methanococcus voltae]|uniref:Energy-converting hydrogenase B subunit F n=1 Tax=Methanococcus voltae PS TaxID=523842 RepID=A0ABT2EU15_METVO|nr:energy conserving hydrogenase EhbF [Methanococcus voltae]MBP2172319.1 energy-converting hydrogenase B subunit F [Methanococcus voltae]MCS3921449.1 energy-converting hydrogenase B subunit F [Methanococcus voltae PS]
MNLLPLLVVFPMFMAIVLNFLHGKDKLIKYSSIALAIILMVLPFIPNYGFYFFGNHGLVETMTSGIAYLFNPAKQLILIVLTLIASLTLISSAGEKQSGLVTSLVLMGLASVTAVVLSEDLFNMYVFYEITAISQTGLLLSTGTENSYKSALRYLIMGNFAGSILLLGIGLLLSISGTLFIPEIHAQLLANPTNPVIYGGALMLIIGLCYGSGLPPFHTIKSEVYSGAKPFISAVLQTFSKFVLVALMLLLFKLFYGLPLFGNLQVLLIVISILGMVFGVVMALLQTDYRKLLSYHAISQGGYVAAGLALGTPLGFVAGVFHAINHVIYKSALFLGAHIVSNENKTSKLDKLGNLLPVMPFVAFMVLCAKLAISGVPPFNGFQSKLLLAEASINANLPELTIIMIVVSIGTFVSMMKAFYMIYLKPNGLKDIEELKKDYNNPMLKYPKFSLLILTILCIVLGIFPEIVTNTLYNSFDNFLSTL